MDLDELYPDSLRAQSRTFSYHIGGEGEEHSPIHIAGMGLHERMKPCWNVRPRGNRDYLCLYFYDPVEFILAGERIASPENKWIILPPGCPHSYGHDRAFWDHSWLHVSGEAVDSALEDGNIPTGRFVHTGGPELFETLLQRLHEELYYNTRPRFDILEYEFRAGLARLDRKINDPRSAVPAVYQQIRLRLDSRYDRDFTLGELAEEAGCSQAVFSRRFRAYFHSSPIDYLIARRIEIACYLLRTTDLSIAELGERVGYPDMYYFSRIFKKRKGCSPRGFRKNFINN